jgi:hypothetical protein
MNIEYMRLKCNYNYGKKCHMVGLAKNIVDGMFACDIVFKTESSGVDEQSFLLEVKCDSGHSVGRCIEWTFHGCQNVTRTF